MSWPLWGTNFSRQCCSLAPVRKYQNGLWHSCCFLSVRSFARTYSALFWSRFYDFDARFPYFFPFLILVYWACAKNPCDWHASITDITIQLRMFCVRSHKVHDEHACFRFDYICYEKASTFLRRRLIEKAIAFSCAIIYSSRSLL